MAEKPVRHDSAHDLNKRSWALAREAAERAARDGTGWIVGVVSGVTALAAGVWFVAQYGPVVGGILALLVAFAVVYVGYLVLMRLDAPKRVLEADNAELVAHLKTTQNELAEAQEASANRVRELEARIEALTSAAIHIESIYVYELPTAEECPEMRFVELYWWDESIGSLPPGPQATFGSNFTEPGTRHQVPAGTGDAFVLVRAINDGDTVLVDVEMDVEYEFFDPVKGRVEPVPKAGCTVKLGRIAPRGQGFGFFYAINLSDKNLFPVPITQARAKRNGISVPVSVFYSDDFRKSPSRAFRPR